MFLTGTRSLSLHAPFTWAYPYLIIDFLPGDTGVDGGDDVGEGVGGGDNSARVLRALEEMMSRHFPIENSREPVEGSKEAAAFALLLRGLLGAFVRFVSCQGLTPSELHPLLGDKLL